MSDVLVNAASAATPTPLWALTEAELADFLAARPAIIGRYARSAQFKAKAGQVLVVLGGEGEADLALFGLGEAARPDGMAFRALPARLPAGDYRLAEPPAGVAAERIALAWALGAYGFDRYRKTPAEPRARLVVADDVDLAEPIAIARACALARDLVNTPPNDMGPVQLEQAARDVAAAHGAEIQVVVGDDLLAAGYPAVHAVGRAADPSRASRKGLSIEIGNTDAEGRLILADALTRAGELDPDLTIDMATLTGAARVALGPQVIPFYTADDALAGELARAAEDVGDPLWRMPLWDGYEDALDSDIADIKNDPDGWAQAGSVTAALFLRRFAPQNAKPWMHLDIFAWNPRGRPGFAAGAEAQAIRALYAVLKARYA